MFILGSQSQKISETPTRPWIFANMNGKIISPHCDCMACLEESRSHVEVLLFYVEAVTKVRDNKTVTQEKAYWMLSASCTEVPYKQQILISRPLVH